MRIWLVKIGEALPTDEGARLYRMGLLARALTSAGHEVLWWNSTLLHRVRKERFSADADVRIASNYRVRLLHSGITYRRNVSLRRWLYHQHIAWKFRQAADTEVPPDAIVAALPTPELALRAVNYGRANRIPVFVDLRDMWPDIYADVAGPWLAPAAQHLLYFGRRRMRRICGDASGLLGITATFLRWGLRYAGRDQGPYDGSFPLGYAREPVPVGTILKQAVEFWRVRGVHPEAPGFVVCFIGSFNSAVSLGPVLAAAKDAALRRRGIRFVLCGAGDYLEQVQQRARSQDNVLFPGFLGRSQLHVLKQLSSAAILPIRARSDYVASLPNKVFEYLEAGLPIASCLDGEVGALLREHDCGALYSSSAGLVELLATWHDDQACQERLSQNAAAAFKRFDAETSYESMARHVIESARQLSMTPSPPTDASP